eukprot:NODE_12397_length_1227_cov_5.320000.p2 GENE.NODE_12397_length_1227_cov_5.320000~~NODE_12397_length_1227_cov_5.320000.p2  ORF type:complete len:210 (+),score=56.05 NODE_12397_length_1227_cov_5.320000:38-631(+)
MTPSPESSPAQSPALAPAPAPALVPRPPPAALPTPAPEPVPSPAPSPVQAPALSPAKAPARTPGPAATPALPALVAEAAPTPELTTQRLLPEPEPVPVPVKRIAPVLPVGNCALEEAETQRGMQNSSNRFGKAAGLTVSESNTSADLANSLEMIVADLNRHGVFDVQPTATTPRAMGSPSRSVPKWRSPVRTSRLTE